jgi:hypothetical protein
MDEEKPRGPLARLGGWILRDEEKVLPAEPSLRRFTRWHDWLTGSGAELSREAELPLALLLAQAPVLPFAVLLATP